MRHFAIIGSGPSGFYTAEALSKVEVGGSAVIVARGKQVISNGRLVGRTQGPTTTTFHYRPRDPMATYQAFFTAGDFIVDTGSADFIAFRKHAFVEALLILSGWVVLVFLRAFFGAYAPKRPSSHALCNSHPSQADTTLATATMSRLSATDTSK